MSLECIGSGVAHAQSSQHFGTAVRRKCSACSFLQRGAYRRKLKPHVPCSLLWAMALPLPSPARPRLKIWHSLGIYHKKVDRATHVTVKYWYSHLLYILFHIPFPTPHSVPCSSFPVLLLHPLDDSRKDSCVCVCASPRLTACMRLQELVSDLSLHQILKINTKKDS